MKIEIEVGEKHARALIAALDLYSRMSMCQLGEIQYLVRHGEIKDSGGKELDAYGTQAFESLLTAMSALFKFAPNSSHSIASEHVSETAKLSYEVKKIVQKAIAIHRDPEPTMRTVDYDGLWRRFVPDGPAPVARVIPDYLKKITWKVRE